MSAEAITPIRSLSLRVVLRRGGITEETKTMAVGPRGLTVITAWARRVGDRVDVEVRTPRAGSLILPARVIEVGAAVATLELGRLGPEAAGRWREVCGYRVPPPAPPADTEDLPELDPSEVEELDVGFEGDGRPTRDLPRSHAPRDFRARPRGPGDVVVTPALPEVVVRGEKSAAARRPPPRPSSPVRLLRRPVIERRGGPPSKP